MNIELTGQIVILDEAHNIEDSSRDAASSSTSQDELQMGIQDCERVGHAGSQTYAHDGLVGFHINPYLSQKWNLCIPTSHSLD